MAEILLVDDDPDLVEACQVVLAGAGHVARGVGSVAEARASLQQRPVDLLVLDVMMDQPDDGIAFAQELRREGCDLPILMLTSISRVSGLHFGKDPAVVPVDEFVEKPIAPDKLVAKVEKLLKAGRAGQCS